MATETIASGGTLSLIQPLTSGTTIYFANDTIVFGGPLVDPHTGTLVLQPEAISVSTAKGTFASATLGGPIVNFLPGAFVQPGDEIVLENFTSFYSEFDFAANAAAENANFAGQANYLAGGVQVFIEPGGAVILGPNAPEGFTLDATTQAIFDEIEQSLFGTTANTATVDFVFGLRTNPNSNRPFVDAVISTETPINPCFAPGVMVLTVDGEVAVERLRPGDRVITFSGGEREIIWTGHREIDVSRHFRPETVWPVVIEQGALGERVPARRLVLSPDHALYIDGLLVQARDLINDDTIWQDQTVRRVRYHHFELTAHDIVFAESVPAESYLDTGHRGLFADDHAKLPRRQ